MSGQTKSEKISKPKSESESLKPILLNGGDAANANTSRNMLISIQTLLNNQLLINLNDPIYRKEVYR